MFFSVKVLLNEKICLDQPALDMQYRFEGSKGDSFALRIVCNQSLPISAGVLDMHYAPKYGPAFTFLGYSSIGKEIVCGETTY